MTKNSIYLVILNCLLFLIAACGQERPSTRNQLKSSTGDMVPEKKCAGENFHWVVVANLAETADNLNLGCEGLTKVDKALETEYKKHKGAPALKFSFSLGAVNLNALNENTQGLMWEAGVEGKTKNGTVLTLNFQQTLDIVTDKLDTDRIPPWHNVHFTAKNTFKTNSFSEKPIFGWIAHVDIQENSASSVEYSIKTRLGGTIDLGTEKFKTTLEGGLLAYIHEKDDDHPKAYSGRIREDLQYYTPGVYAGITMLYHWNDRLVLKGLVEFLANENLEMIEHTETATAEYFIGKAGESDMYFIFSFEHQEFNLDHYNNDKYLVPSILPMDDQRTTTLAVQFRF